MEIRRGDVLMVDFGDRVGSVQSGKRPAVVVGNDRGNEHGPICVVLPMTSQTKSNLPTHCRIAPTHENGLRYESTVLAEQPITIDKSKILGVMGRLNDNHMATVDVTIKVSLGLFAAVRAG